VVIGAMREPNPTPKRLRESFVEMRVLVDAMRAKVARKQA